MTKREKIIVLVCYFLPPFIVAVAVVAANVRPYNNEDHWYDTARFYGFPFSYRSDYVMNRASALADGGTIDSRRDRIIWRTTYDNDGMGMDAGVGVFLGL